MESWQLPASNQAAGKTLCAFDEHESSVMEQLYSTQPYVGPRMQLLLPRHIQQQPGQRKVENLPLLPCWVAKLCQPLIPSSTHYNLY